MYDDISYVFTNKDIPWTLSMMSINKYVTCLYDYALYDDCPKKVPRRKGCVDAQLTRLAYDTVDGSVSLAMEHRILAE
jgi:hypothetical protein